MSNTLTSALLPQERVEIPARPSVQQTAPLDRTLEKIKADSLNQPETYLEETEVPDGGE